MPEIPEPPVPPNMTGRRLSVDVAAGEDHSTTIEISLAPGHINRLEAQYREMIQEAEINQRRAVEEEMRRASEEQRMRANGRSRVEVRSQCGYDGSVIYEAYVPSSRVTVRLDRRDFERRRISDLMREQAYRIAREITQHLERDIFEGLARISTERTSSRHIVEARERDAIMRGRDILRRPHYQNDMINYVAASFGPSPPPRTRDNSVPPDPQHANTPFEWLNEVPAFFEMDGKFKATLLKTEDDFYQEAKNMRHCLWERYTDRAKEQKDIVVYHVYTPKHICKSGVTLSYDLIKNELGNIKKVELHLAEGKARSKPSDPALTDFYNIIQAELKAHFLGTRVEGENNGETQQRSNRRTVEYRQEGGRRAGRDPRVRAEVWDEGHYNIF